MMHVLVSSAGGYDSIPTALKVAQYLDLSPAKLS